MMRCRFVLAQEANAKRSAAREPPAPGNPVAPAPTPSGTRLGGPGGAGEAICGWWVQILDADRKDGLARPGRRRHRAVRC